MNVLVEKGNKIMNFNLSYDDMFMNMAYLLAMKSKDENTKIGAVIVDDEHNVVSTGFNSFPRGINDNIKERQEKPEKYYYFSHAERNSIYNAARIGVSLKNCNLYTPGFPCTNCALAIIQSGIKEIILCENWDYLPSSQKWKDEAKISKEMFDEAGIKIRYLNTDFLQIQACKNGIVNNF